MSKLCESLNRRVQCPIFLLISKDVSVLDAREVGISREHAHAARARGGEDEGEVVEEQGSHAVLVVARVVDACALHFAK